MKYNFLYKILVVFLIAVLFCASYILGSFVYGEDSGYTGGERTEDTTDINSVKIVTENINTNTYYNVPLAENEQEWVSVLCRAYNVPIKFVYAVMKVESDFCRDAISGEDYGIMQINRINHDCMREQLGVDDFLDFFDNSKCGVYLLGEYFNRYNNLNMAAMAYHYGNRGASEFWAEDIYDTPYTDAVNEAMNYIIVDNGYN